MMNKKVKIFLIVICSILILWLIVFAIGFNYFTRHYLKPTTISETKSQDAEPVPEPVADPEPEPTPKSSQKESEEDRINAYMTLIETSLKDNFEDSYTVDLEKDSKTIKICVWADDITESLYQIHQSDDPNLRKEWDDTVETIRSTSEGFTDGLKRWELSDYHVSVNLLNNANHENVLLTTYDDTIFYDVMKEGDF